MNDSVFLCPSDELVEGRYREFRIEQGGDPVWLIATRIGESPRAWLNVCPHQGRPLNFAPDRFLTDPEQRLVCAHHGAVFEPDGGVCVSGPCQRASLTAVPVSENEGRVSVECTTPINTPG
ncbi:Rieske 2Fe-2S domain-containing protein [Wenzhouxiangella sp. XN201]|uniref:Rieske 2Fe-2S domain-containing protein n=1 Tax=Wenzhouxiangella sp. XN201 TaxID=2710755 RepID=UPI0013CD86D1|nr:Rieske 2Fe-2S domain-containing protein [Wenzhouxiangella sp. XN201]